MDAKEQQSISAADASQTLRDEIRERLWLHTVSVFTVDGDRPDYRGTATCVAADGNSYLVTAAHVWKTLRGPRFALSLEADRLLIPMYPDLVEARTFEPSGGPEHGPDLAIIRIPDIVAADLRNVKSFYNLDRRRAHVGDAVPGATALWAVIGAPPEQSTFGESEAVLRAEPLRFPGCPAPSDVMDTTT